MRLKAIMGICDMVVSSRLLVLRHRLRSPLPEIRGHPIVGIAKIFHNSFNWMCTFSMPLWGSLTGPDVEEGRKTSGH